MLFIVDLNKSPNRASISGGSFRVTTTLGFCGIEWAGGVFISLKDAQMPAVSSDESLCADKIRIFMRLSALLRLKFTACLAFLEIVRRETNFYHIRLCGRNFDGDRAKGERARLPA